MGVLESKVLEVGTHGGRIAPRGKAGGGAIPCEMMGGLKDRQVNRGEIERANVVVGRGCSDVGRLNSTTADAIVAFIRALIRAVLLVVGRCAVALLTMANLVGPANEGAGEDEPG